MNKPFLSRWLTFLLAMALALPAFAAQTIPLAAGQTAANSSTVTVTSSGVLTLFPSSGSLPPVTLSVQAQANGIWVPVGVLTNTQSVFIEWQPGAYRVVRPDITRYGVSVGVASDLATGSGGGAVTVAQLPAALGQTTLANGLAVSPASDWLLPAFAATPTFNLGTISTAATAANQSTANTTLSTIATNTTGVALAANQGTAAAAESTSSGQTAKVAAGFVTTSAPTYTTTKTDPLSLTTAGALRVDGSGATQPVSGTFWQATQPISAASLPLPTGAATAANQPGFGTAGSANANVLTVQGIASMTKLLVTPDSVALPANQSVNVAQINGVTTTMGNGTSGTGVQRVTIASDSTGQVAIAGTLPAFAATPTVSLSAASSGGWSAYSANVTNSAVAVDASAGQIGWYLIGNQNTSVCYLQIFNLASGSVSLGSTTPTYSWPIVAFGGANASVPSGLAFGTAISIAATTTRTGSTACTSGLDVNIGFK